MEGITQFLYYDICNKNCIKDFYEFILESKTHNIKLNSI